VCVEEEKGSSREERTRTCSSTIINVSRVHGIGISTNSEKLASNMK